MSANRAKQDDTSPDMISLATLPYDLLLNIARHLELHEIHALQLSCKALHGFTTTRPVYRNLATALLKRCRALPLHGFQRLSDLTDEQLVDAVNHETRLETAWLTRGPRPSSSSPYFNTAEGSTTGNRSWYKIISAPPNEEVAWLSPITSSYSLCATKSRKVVCWDVHRDECLAEWDPQERWELWKCRVEFDIRTVFFTMAKILQRSLDDRVMEFVLMKLEFPDKGEPIFSELAMFKTIGVVMNVFLLDPSSCLLSAFVWVASSNTIGLYALLDWRKEEYVFIDTGIECSMSSNWSCILYQEQIVIHSEESDAAHQYFYPISVLQQYARLSTSSATFVANISQRLRPVTTMSAPFIFPPLTRSVSPASARDEEQGPQLNGHAVVDAPTETNGDDTGSGTVADGNPFPYPPWYPESAHFVRQWWPTLASVPRLSCTVVLLADHEPDTHRTRYVLAQHYFKVPLIEADELEQMSATAAQAVEAALMNGSAAPSENGSAVPTVKAGSVDVSKGEGSSRSASTSSSETGEWSGTGTTDSPTKQRGAESSMMRLWYVSEPFEVVCVLDGVEDDDMDPDGGADRPRPLMAVDFGHAVWIEFAFPPEVDNEDKRLRFVTFPPVTNDRDVMGYGLGGTADSLEGIVRGGRSASDVCVRHGVQRSCEYISCGRTVRWRWGRWCGLRLGGGLG
ncbi:uncharacterized protein TRAVEDRAFT_137354 [Trametes versicolor FP-101664 SS1]|uniref:F-box domain-containing protein n=1 Tax=Trametes versicolor (strain FP-101664) TaxID=717944 RepID=R7S6F5_TRAVS|nr:uncharacterized protein TRAVEDRAFT_137354 [Trametes versicolor FP-101664 SS1]EIW51476.1 hypothetical protein TRAVEDRAFT_137354 [Trametes versicolor FP-101664 SS1]